MTRIRQWALTVVVALALALSFSTVASADPGDPGHFSPRGGGWSSTGFVDPGDPGH